MGRKDPRVDAYIEEASSFARPILRRLRKVVHQGCPDVSETLKWSMPSFEYKGILCGMAAFKAHAIFGFWKHNLLEKRLESLGKDADSAMGSFGCLRKLSDLPSDAVLLSLVRDATELNDKEIKVPARRKAAPKKVVVPDNLSAALKKNKKASATFTGLSPSHRREYIEWITEAKREETRARRLKTTIELLAAGKTKNWKYEKKV